MRNSSRCAPPSRHRLRRRSCLPTSCRNTELRLTNCAMHSPSTLALHHRRLCNWTCPGSRQHRHRHRHQHQHQARIAMQRIPYPPASLCRVVHTGTGTVAPTGLGGNATTASDRRRSGRQHIPHPYPPRPPPHHQRLPLLQNPWRRAMPYSSRPVPAPRRHPSSPTPPHSEPLLTVVATTGPSLACRASLRLHLLQKYPPPHRR